MRVRDLKVIVRFDLSRQLRSPSGVLVVAAIAIIYGWLLYRLHGLQGELRSLVGDELAAAGSPGGEFVRWIIGWLTDLSSGAVGEMLARRPADLLVFFFASLMLTPFLAIISSFDQLASCINTRHIRYLLLRSDRLSLFFGRFLGAWLFFALVFALVCGGMALIHVFGGGGAENLAYMGRIWILNVLFALPFVALTAMAGVMTAHPALVLLVAFGSQFFIWAVGAIGRFGSPHAASVRYAFPTAFKYDLTSEQLGEVFIALGHMTGFALVFLALGVYVVRRRDV